MDWLFSLHLFGLHSPFLLAAQTAGALLSNALWGWWGDRYGKRSLYEGVALLRAVPPLLIIVWISMVGIWPIPTISGFVTVFFLLGAVGNGITIAVIGYLMEISPDDRRPAYSGYFNALVAPAALLPLAGAAIVEATREVPAHPAIESHVPGYIRGQAENLLAGRPARISSTIPLSLRERIGSPQDRDA